MIRALSLKEKKENLNAWAEKCKGTKVVYEILSNGLSYKKPIPRYIVPTLHASRSYLYHIYIEAASSFGIYWQNEQKFRNPPRPINSPPFFFGLPFFPRFHDAARISAIIACATISRRDAAVRRSKVRR